MFHYPDDSLDLKELLQHLFDRFRHLLREDDVVELLDDECAGVGHGQVGQLDRGGVPVQLGTTI